MSLDDELREFSRISLFASLEFDARRQLAYSAETRILRSGDILFRAGESSDCGYVLIGGMLAINGLEQTLQPLLLIGETALITETVRPATIVAKMPATVLKITRSLFTRTLKAHPRSAVQVRSLVEQRLSAMTNDMADTRARSFLDVSEPTSRTSP